MMKLTTWLKKRARLQEEYGRLCSEGAKLVFLYDRGRVDAQALLAHSRRLDAAYLAWCATDRIETTL